MYFIEPAFKKHIFVYYWNRKQRVEPPSSLFRKSGDVSVNKSKIKSAFVPLYIHRLKLILISSQRVKAFDKNDYTPSKIKKKEQEHYLPCAIWPSDRRPGRQLIYWPITSLSSKPADKALFFLLNIIAILSQKAPTRLLGWHKRFCSNGFIMASPWRSHAAFFPFSTLTERGG